MDPAEIDTTELMDKMSNVLAQWIMLQSNDKQQKAIFDAIPAQVTVDERNATITGEKGDTIQAYPVREVKGGGTQWVFLCENNIVIRLFDLGNGRYTLSVPKMERLEMRKIKTGVPAESSRQDR